MKGESECTCNVSESGVRVGYNVTDASPSTRDVENQKSEIRDREKHDKDPCQNLQWMPWPVPAVAARIIELLRLLRLSAFLYPTLRYPLLHHLDILHLRGHALIVCTLYMQINHLDTCKWTLHEFTMYAM